MRVALFSPMPPSKSGIADYTAALLEPLSTLAEVEVLTESSPPMDRARYDCALYQIGNNSYHAFAYKQALEWPGVVVLHEANLHHLVAEMTIKAGDWEGYLEAVRFDAGEGALAYARRVRALEVGPDYEGVPMLRRVLNASKGVIVHSHFVERQIRCLGYSGPLAVIPHGAWIPAADRLGFRHRLGVDSSTSLIGIFGFLKPYKRITESLRAFKRLLRLHPTAKMILVGEPHPEYPLKAIIDNLGIESSVRVLGFTAIEDFVGYIAACDIILNLRYPTVGESSGTLLRSLGLGKAVIVSDVGSFSEYPDEICLKVPVDRREEGTLFEFLNLLVERPTVRQTLGEKARDWVERECNWYSVAERYRDFLDAIATDRPWNSEEAAIAKQVSAGDLTAPVTVSPEYVKGWATDESSRKYFDTHVTRLNKTLSLIPFGGPGRRSLELGVYFQITPALKTKLEFEEVRGCYYGPAGTVEHKQVTSAAGETFDCQVELFDAERDPFPYDSEYFDVVLCCELLEHLRNDPMQMMCEINRILKPGGSLILTTPNITSLRAISAMLQGYHPGFFPAYIKPAQEGDEVEARHAREYAPREIGYLLYDSGFEIARLETDEFREEPHPEHGWVRHLLEQYKESTELRGEGIYAVGVKRGPVRRRYPDWLYS
ncbi:MAG TPA: glycosyltransferase [Bryobacteraceae bacterium]|nr:glycosyltransferase [Bryobacteraceae bacterium]